MNAILMDFISSRQGGRLLSINRPQICPTRWKNVALKTEYLLQLSLQNPDCLSQYDNWRPNHHTSVDDTSKHAGIMERTARWGNES